MSSNVLLAFPNATFTADAIER